MSACDLIELHVEELSSNYATSMLSLSSFTPTLAHKMQKHKALVSYMEDFEQMSFSPMFNWRDDFHPDFAKKEMEEEAQLHLSISQKFKAHILEVAAMTSKSEQQKIREALKQSLPELTEEQQKVRDGILGEDWQY